jgi:hypothetical protein
MKRIARRILWNVYAWPITIILLVYFAMNWHESPVRIMLVFLLFMPALIVLHLNTWDEEVGTPTSRKVYAFTFIICILLFCIVLPLFRSKPLNSEKFLGLLILLPLFIAVFSYAFRNWEGIKNQPSLGMRRGMWNFYAWPVTLLFALTVVLELARIELLPTLNVIISIPALVALHLHIRNKRFLSTTFWRLYAFAFVAWELLYHLLLEPMYFGNSLSTVIIITLVILLPLYVGLFKYAFRDWNKFDFSDTAQEPTTTDGTNIADRSMKISLGRSFVRSSIKVSTIVICILIIVLVIIPVSFWGFILKSTSTREQYKNLYFIPIERKIEDIKSQTQDNVKINYANFEMKLPCAKIEKRFDSAKYKSTAILIYKGKGITMHLSTRIPPKDEFGTETSFDTYFKMFYLTPYQLNLFNPDDFKRIFVLLLLKETSFNRGKIYKFETPNIKGFQFGEPINAANKIVKVKIGDPNNTKRFVEVEIFDKNDKQYELTFGGFSQKEIDYTLASIRFKE